MPFESEGFEAEHCEELTSLKAMSTEPHPSVMVIDLPQTSDE